MNTVKLTDQELLVRYRNGNMRSLGTLYSRYSALVYGVCMKYLKNTHSSEDAVMAIFEELITKLKDHEISNFKSWLHIVSKNYCLQQLRKKKVHLERPDDERIMQLSAESHLDDMKILEQKELRLRDCIATLRDEQRQIIELFYFAGNTYKHIAEINGISTETVRSRIQNGRRNLRMCLNSDQKES